MGNSNFIFAQKITGDGNVVKEIRSISAFDKIEAGGVINVVLIQGNGESLIVEADKNLIPLVQTKVEGSTLYISTKEKTEIEESTKMNVYITFGNLKEIVLTGVGNVNTENPIKSENLTVKNNSVGNMNLKLDCVNLKIENNSVGNTTLTGNADNAEINLNSVGNLKAFDLIVRVLKIDNNSIGNAEVNSEKEIYISQNGMGNISYKGNAVVKKLENNGTGNVKKD